MQYNTNTIHKTHYTLQCTSQYSCCCFTEMKPIIDRLSLIRVSLVRHLIKVFCSQITWLWLLLLWKITFFGIVFNSSYIYSPFFEVDIEKTISMFSTLLSKLFSDPVLTQYLKLLIDFLDKLEFSESHHPVFWFNYNLSVEHVWIPRQTGAWAFHHPTLSTTPLLTNILLKIHLPWKIHFWRKNFQKYTWQTGAKASHQRRASQLFDIQPFKKSTYEKYIFEKYTLEKHICEKYTLEEKNPWQTGAEAFDHLNYSTSNLFVGVPPPIQHPPSTIAPFF